MIRILHSVSNMDRAGIETMLMNYYRYMDKSKVQFDFLCNKKKPGAYDNEITALGGRIYHTPGLNPVKYPMYLKYMKELFQEHPEYKIVEAHNGALGVYALHAAKVSKIPVRIFHAHGASITKDWKLPIKLVCKACLPTNMTHHFSCGVEAAKCYFGQKVVDENDYVLIPNAIDVARFIYNPKIRNKIRKENNLENKHVVGHVGRFMAQKNHTFLMDVFAEVLKIDSQAHLVLLGDGELMDEIKRKAADLGISEHVTFVGNVGYFVEEGLLGGIACFSLFYSLLKSSWKKATFKNSRNMNNSFFLCFVSYVAVMLSVADVSQLLWVIIALYITYNAKAQAIASE